jgi:hypothetical protein
MIYYNSLLPVRIRQSVTHLLFVLLSLGVEKTTLRELYDLYSAPHIILVNKSRGMRWVGPVARMWDRRGAYRILGRLEGDHAEDLDIDGRIILKWIINMWYA